MGKRRRNRSDQMACYLFSPDGKTGPRFLRRISEDEGKALVKKGSAVRYEDPDTHECIGFQLLADEKPVTMGSPRKIMPELDRSNAVFSRVEIDAIEGVYGESHTATLTDEEKQHRVNCGLPEMDIVEAALVKQRFYQTTH